MSLPSLPVSPLPKYSAELQVLPEPVPPFSLVPAGTYTGQSLDLPQSDCESRLLIDTPHDGQVIPTPFWDIMRQRARDPERCEALIREHYAIERDWGASLVADALSVALNRFGYPSAGHYRSHIARVLLDFARFPGSTPPKADHLHRFAINYPSSRYLDHHHKKRLLEDYYDAHSALLEPLLNHKRVKISLHTYDTYNQAGTLRPCVSIINRPISYQLDSAMPVGCFDPLYPAELLEHTADRKLTYRLSLAFEEAHFSAAHNYPYLLPNGSLEVRSQVWSFFHFLRARFEERSPETRERSTYQSVWGLLLDTNLRSTQSEDLRSYLHMFRREPAHLTKEYSAARIAYEDICDFFEAKRDELLRAYRTHPDRVSAFVLEVRKDLIWRFADRACRQPLEPRYDQVNLIAEIIARSLIAYLKEES